MYDVDTINVVDSLLNFLKRGYLKYNPYNSWWPIDIFFSIFI